MKKILPILLLAAVASFGGNKKNMKIEILRILQDGTLALKCRNSGESTSNYYALPRTSLNYDAVLMSSLYAYESDNANLYIDLQYDDNTKYITQFALHEYIWN